MYINAGIDFDIHNRMRRR